MEAVGEVEGQRGDHDDDEKQFRAHGRDIPVSGSRS
jgi:hypothetical protein